MDKKNVTVDLNNVSDEIREKFHEAHIEKIKKIFKQTDSNSNDCGMMCYTENGTVSGDCTGNPFNLIQTCTGMLVMLVRQLNSEENKKKLIGEIISCLEKVEAEINTGDSESNTD